jgi:hypothetical protein
LQVAAFQERISGEKSGILAEGLFFGSKHD